MQIELKYYFHYILNNSLLNNGYKRVKNLKKINLLTHNQGVPGSCPGGPTENQAVTKHRNCFFVLLITNLRIKN
jgi:hypothetical protein